MRKKLTSTILAAVVVAFLLTGCGKFSGTSTDSSTKKEEVTDTKGTGDVQVGIVLPTKDEPRWLQDQAQFEKKMNALLSVAAPAYK